MVCVSVCVRVAVCVCVCVCVRVCVCVCVCVRMGGGHWLTSSVFQKFVTNSSIFIFGS